MSNNNEDGGVYYDPDENMFNNDEDGGIYFNPEDQELIKKHLLPKLATYRKPKSKEEDCEEDFIEMKNVYDKEPWLLDHTNHPLLRKNEWFYFVTRSQVSVKNIGRGRNSKRRIIGDNDGGSWWKPNAKKYIKEEETDEIIGKKQTLKFTNSNNNKKQKSGDGTSVVVPGSNSSWIMYEYSLPDENTFQELVLCKIRKISNFKDEEVEAMEVTHNVVGEGWIGDLSDKFASTGLDNQQQTPIYAAPLARLGDRSLPIEEDESDDDEELMNQELDIHLF